MQRPAQKSPQDGLDVAADKADHPDAGRRQGRLQGSRNRPADQDLGSQAGYLLSPAQGIMMVQRFGFPFDFPTPGALNQVDVIGNVEDRGDPSLPVSQRDFHGIG